MTNSFSAHRSAKYSSIAEIEFGHCPALATEGPVSWNIFRAVAQASIGHTVAAPSTHSALANYKIVMPTLRRKC